MFYQVFVGLVDRDPFVILRKAMYFQEHRSELSERESGMALAAATHVFGVYPCLPLTLFLSLRARLSIYAHGEPRRPTRCTVCNLPQPDEDTLVDDDGER
jgi:hypothetical protein